MLVSIPYRDVVLLKEELRQIWTLLPSNTFTIDQLATCMKEIRISSNRKDAKLVLERLLQMGLVIKK